MASSVLINIDVADLATARDFYVSAFGWHVGRLLGPAAQELLGAGVPIYLLAQPEGSSPAPGVADRSYQRHWTPVHLDIVVDDLDAALERAVAAGARRETTPTTHAWGRIVRLADPFGNGLCLLQFLNRGYDELVEVGAGS